VSLWLFTLAEKNNDIERIFCAESGSSGTLSRDEMCLFLSITLAEKNNDIERIFCAEQGSSVTLPI